MAESADALRSGRSVRKDVGVQVSPSAPNLLARVVRRGLYFDKRLQRVISDDRCEGTREGWSLGSLRTQRKVRAAQSGVPGESQGDRHKPADSPDWHNGFDRCESNSDECRLAQPGGVKRAILPAAISESADKDGGSPRLEVESSHEGDDVTGIAWRCRER